MAKAGEFIGYTIGGAIVGQMDYDWAFEVPHYLPVGGSWSQYVVGYTDTFTQQTYSLNGAWGAWNSTVGAPNQVDWSAVVSAAKSYINIYNYIGWGWSGIDDGLSQGSNGPSFATITDKDERMAKWNSVLDLIDSTVSWVSGNVRDGGLGFLSMGDGTYFGFATYGLYTNADGEEKIAATSTNWSEPASTFEHGALGVFCHNRTTVGNTICWICGNRAYGTIYTIRNPEVVNITQLVWTEGTSGAFSDCLDSSRQRFGNGLVYNRLVDMNSIRSPYSWPLELYWPETKIDDESYQLTWGDPIDIIEEKEAAGGDAGDNDGDGDFDNSSDSIPLTTEDQFNIDAQSSGFVTVYKPSKATLQNFANWLYGTLPTDFSSWLENIAKLQLNPMDAIISLNLSHYDAPTDGSQDIMFYSKSSGFSAPVVSKLTKIFDCGYLSNTSGGVHEYSGNFLDYGNMSNIKIALPYCGTFSLSTNEVMGSVLHLQYVIDLLSGACVAELEVIRERSHVTGDPALNSQIYRFPGNIFLQVPISAVDYSNIMRGQMSLAAGVGTALASAATGNALGVLSGASQVAGAAMSMSPTVERVGSVGSSYGYMSFQKPFIIQEYPWYNWPERYSNYYGKPTYNYGQLSSYEGYTEIDPGTLWTDKFDWITQEEEEMIKRICSTGGIYIDNSSTYNYDPEA